jgi:hypothetical protein
LPCHSKGFTPVVGPDPDNDTPTPLPFSTPPGTHPTAHRNTTQHSNCNLKPTNPHDQVLLHQT